MLAVSHLLVWVFDEKVITFAINALRMHVVGRPSVSLIYNKIIDCITKPLSIITIWNRELSDLNLSVDWERVWSYLSLTSTNLAHRLIHFKVIHRAYITPYKRFQNETTTQF